MKLNTTIIATAEPSTWGSGGRRVLLGEWCRSFLVAAPNLASEFDVATFYNPKIERKDEDYRIVLALYERLLQEVAMMLNEHHRVDYSSRYWRIFIGPWLYAFISVVFNRWSTLQCILIKYQPTHAVISALHLCDTITSTRGPFMKLMLNKSWNQALYARLISGWFDVSCTFIPEVFIAAEVKSARSNFRRLALVGRDSVFKLMNRLAHKESDVFIMNSGLPQIEEQKILLSLGQCPFPWPKELAPSCAPNMEERMRFSLAVNGDAFERCLRELIPEQMPTIYLEGYHELKSFVEDLPWPKQPSAIFTSGSFQNDEVFKLWTAQKVEAGSRYVLGQHGGNYGTSRYILAEPNDMASAGQFLSWGNWFECKEGSTELLLSCIGKKRRLYDKCGPALLVLGPPDPKHPWSDHEHYYQYLLAQYELVAALPAEIRLGLVIRLHPAQDWWSESPAIEWKKRFPEVVIDSGSGTLATSARQCRLLISTYNSSSLYEAMALGDPVIAFWQRDRDLLREEAIPWFEMLSNVGILHYDALQAAQKITDIWGDVEGWWSTQPLVNVRSLFCQRFAHIPTKPLNHLKHSLRLSKSSSEAYS